MKPIPTATCLFFGAITALLFLVSCGSDNDDEGPAEEPAAVALVADALQAAPPWTEPGEALRFRQSLDGTWLFTPEGYAAREVPVPCFWEAVPPATPQWERYRFCPGYLDGTADEGLAITEGDRWNERTVHRGTYRLTVDIPEPAPLTRLRFEAIHHQATVYWNGREIGTHTGPYLEAVFDAIDTRSGANELQVDLVDGSALLGADGLTQHPVGYYSLTDITGLYRSVTLEGLPAVHVADAFVVPSVRRGDLTIQYRIENRSREYRALWIRARAVDEDGETGWESAPRRMGIAAGAEAAVAVAGAWEDPRLWSPSGPNLYTLRTLLQTEDGIPLDLREDRFGFREVWIEGDHYVLNGERMNLMGDSLDDQASRPRYWALRYLSCDTARDTLLRIKELNFGAVRFHQAPPPGCVFDLTDELGILVIAEAPIFARIDIHPPLNWGNAYFDNAMAYLDDWVPTVRNHPSIVMWSVENEGFLYGFGMSPRQVWELQFPAKEADTIARPDGVRTTPRPINWDGDSALLLHFGFDVETVNWHYPYWDWWTITPDNEWYDDAVANFAPYVVEGKPYGVGETMDVRRPELPGRTLDMAKAMQGQAVRAMRILGYSDIRPYKLNWTWHDFDPDGWEHPWARYYHALYSEEQKERLVENVRDAYHPIAVFDYDYARQGANPDGTFGPRPLDAAPSQARVLVAMNDSFLPGTPQHVSWEAFLEESGETLATGAYDVIVPTARATGGRLLSRCRRTTCRPSSCFAFVRRWRASPRDPTGQTTGSRSRTDDAPRAR